MPGPRRASQPKTGASQNPADDRHQDPGPTEPPEFRPIPLCPLQVSSLAFQGHEIGNREAIEPGTTVHTDGWDGYAGLESHSYSHKITVLRGRGKNAASELLPRVHIVASLLKRWLLGTHQGSVSLQHLDYYLDEFTFRFNRRKSSFRGKLFYRLVEQAHDS